MSRFLKYLKGGDLRSIARTNEVISLIRTQTDFDELFQYLSTNDRLLVMRAADAIEKITLQNPEYLATHNQDIINLLNTAANKELKWHLALIASRPDWTRDELKIVWDILIKWATDKKESKIVRVNSVQALFDLLRNNKKLRRDFDIIVQKITAENIPSLNARLRKLKIEK